jgi:hypothetical protein
MPRFSLRTLLIVVTLVAVTLGFRIEYLQRWADFHERESLRFEMLGRGKSELDPKVQETFAASTRHFILSCRFREAMFRPWAAVDASQPVLTHGAKCIP